MWQDEIGERYKWAKLRTPLDVPIYEITMAEEEEELALYVLGMHVRNETDLQFFTKQEKESIRRLLTVSIEDSARHRDLLQEIRTELETRRARHAGPRAQ